MPIGIRCLGRLAAMLAVLFAASPVQAEDGHDLWLRYRPLIKATAMNYRQAATEIVMDSNTPTLAAARTELVRGLSGLLGNKVGVTNASTKNGSLVLAVAGRSPVLADLGWSVSAVGPEGYVIRTAVWHGHKVTVIAANADVGVLYGAFRYLRQIQTGQSLKNVDIQDRPRVALRVLNHWDDLQRVALNYAGFSIWDWQKLPEWRDPIYTEYARANASIGINGVVLNQINSDAAALTPLYLKKVAALAEVFRPYGIKVYLSARLTAPMELGGLATADPLDPAVKAWWVAKADEIYATIPDFGGFLVKADSEGQPGPQVYHRTQADGANMLADAVRPHGGVIMWRAFVYANDPKVDRVKQAYDAFKPLDGSFRDNVIVQVKNGPLDFQPREPFSPLFGALPQTSTGMEVEVAKEYLGFATHLVYLGAVWQEVLDADTYAKGQGSTVAKVIDRSIFETGLSLFAGVGNIGTDRDWCGSTFNQANWYAFGRLAWDPHASARAIAEEWLAMTFTPDKAFVVPVADMMMASREAVVDYMMPLGLAHQFGTGHHYGPEPWGNNSGRADWDPVTYNGANKGGIGVDRTAAGTNAVSQYAPELAARFADLGMIDDQYLLWFHHVPWDYRMRSGETVWQELIGHYDRGVREVQQMQATWSTMKPYVDEDRFAKTAVFLEIQEKEAKWWRDASIAYFQSVSGLALPEGAIPPEHSLEYYKSLKYPHAPY
jgi:alpha-glucuronidase